MSSIYIVAEQPPTPDEFNALREKVGWDSVDPALAKASLAHPLFHVVVRDQQKLIGMARVVGDGYLYFYIQDVVVDPDYQSLGIGKMLMDKIESYLARAAKPGATVGLLAAKGKEAFYRRYGYLERDGEALGKGMCRFIQRQKT
ncbi:GNAT family N-acetyltransferase [Aliiglaciecola sp. CAU 1673]|uniref:GNAT family N-acetyltransferase n=1 Tax=Aliiglaciecola sp. CAU 1673 TaxID=3032595 RepID=UPI0023D9F40E|nr:GNAT family N-acetyltransferase [Aliiglaciecola sp. CAU 1673]MDF2176918.1 GNAT family N-acetyltransferase [Aliiglaciecola sp. CAU 1673]